MKKVGLNVFVFLFIYQSLNSETWIVDTTGFELDSLQQAVYEAWTYPGIDTVLLMNGTYNLLSSGLIMYDSTVLMSLNGALQCTLTVDGADQVISCNFGDSTSHVAKIKGLTLTGAYRGIYLFLSSPVVESCRITDNTRGIEMYQSSARITGCYISNNYSLRGSGIYIDDYSHPAIINNIITENQAFYDGAGIFINGKSDVRIIGNTITYNATIENFGMGGGIAIFDSSRAFIESNYISGDTSGYGSGVGLYGGSDAVLIDNTLSENTSYRSATVFSTTGSSVTMIKNKIVKNYSYGSCTGVGAGGKSATLIENLFYNNQWYGAYVILGSGDLEIVKCLLVNNRFGGIALEGSLNVHISKCVIADNPQTYGTIYIDNMTAGNVVIDSSFIVDNGGFTDQGGILYVGYIDPDSISLHNSNIYYNTFQPDYEIVNQSNMWLKLQNNFWWDTTVSAISCKIYGNAYYEPWENDFVSGVPGEPISVDSVRNYSDTTYSIIKDTLYSPDTLYLSIFGETKLPDIREAAIAILKTSIVSQGIAVALFETDTSSGIYQGKAYVIDSVGNMSVRRMDICQYIPVNPEGDTIWIYANVDPTKRFKVIYRPLKISEKARDRIKLNFACFPVPFKEKNVITYTLSKKSEVTLQVLDINGRLVCTLVNGIQLPGNYRLIWNANDMKGRRLSAGTYFYKIKINKFTLTKKVELVK